MPKLTIEIDQEQMDFLKEQAGSQSTPEKVVEIWLALHIVFRKNQQLFHSMNSRDSQFSKKD